jgi:hypothetical protein
MLENHMGKSRRALWTLLVAGGLAVAASVAAWLPGCDESPGPTQCLESIAPTSAIVPAGSFATFTVSVGNPDNDNVGGVTVTWTLSGGGTLDRDQTTISLVDQTDDYGNPAGTLGTTSDAFHAVGPAGPYTLQVSVSAGGGCLAHSLPAVALEVTGSLPPDAGAPDGSSEGGEDASSEAGEDGSSEGGEDAGGDSEASDSASGDASDGA